MRGTTTGEEELGRLVVEFNDGSRVVVRPEALISQPDGSYRLAKSATELTGSASTTEQIVVPVVAEELAVETERVARGKVRIHKRVETKEEIVDAPVVSEQVVVEHVPVNKLVDDVPPEPRDEDGVLVIPLIEEVLVVERRLLVREEVRVSKRRTTTNNPQKVVLRREIVDIERETLDSAELPAGKQDLTNRKEQQ
jgi:uncharacterized protein (TIGR02271 family)